MFENDEPFENTFIMESMRRCHFIFDRKSLSSIGVVRSVADHLNYSFTISISECFLYPVLFTTNDLGPFRGITGERALPFERFCLCDISIGCLWGNGMLLGTALGAGILLMPDERLEIGATRCGIFDGFRLLCKINFVSTGAITFEVW